MVCEKIPLFGSSLSVLHHVRFEVTTAVLLKTEIFWDMTLCHIAAGLSLQYCVSFKMCVPYE
jgi:hypothetical protein